MNARDVYQAVTGLVVRALRERCDLTQGDLATRAGVSQSALSRFENGETPPDIYELRRIAVALGTGLGYVIAKIDHGFAAAEASRARLYGDRKGWPSLGDPTGVALIAVGVAEAMRALPRPPAAPATRVRRRRGGR